jgi:hypothetical protein
MFCFLLLPCLCCFCYLPLISWVHTLINWNTNDNYYYYHYHHHHLTFIDPVVDGANLAFEHFSPLMLNPLKLRCSPNRCPVTLCEKSEHLNVLDFITHVAFIRTIFFNDFVLVLNMLETSSYLSSAIQSYRSKFQLFLFKNNSVSSQRTFLLIIIGILWKAASI